MCVQKASTWKLANQSTQWCKRCEKLPLMSSLLVFRLKGVFWLVYSTAICVSLHTHTHTYCHLKLRKLAHKRFSSFCRKFNWSSIESLEQHQHNVLSYNIISASGIYSVLSQYCSALIKTKILFSFKSRWYHQAYWCLLGRNIKRKNKNKKKKNIYKSYILYKNKKNLNDKIFDLCLIFLWQFPMSVNLWAHLKITIK